MKLCLSLCLLLPLAASAQKIIVESGSLFAEIPDNDLTGYTTWRSIDGLGLGFTGIQRVEVNLIFSGGWNGDLYSYLQHGDTGFSILLNRPGRTALELDGSGTSGLNITFSDDASSDLHTAIPLTGGPVTGLYQPDGRNIHPLQVLSSDPRTAMLSSFNGLDANGPWRLFVADLSAGEVSTLQSWSLVIHTIPEPGTAVFLSMGLSSLLVRRRRQPAGGR